LVFIPPSATGINAWAKLGNPKWTWDAFLPYLKRSYTARAPDSTVAKDLGYGVVHEETSGPINLSYPGLTAERYPLIRAWNDAFSELGSDATATVFSDKSLGGRAYTATVDPDTGHRSYAASKYGVPASKRSNVTIITGATVRRVLFSGSTPDVVATGVEVSTKDGPSVTVNATKEVILSAGTFHTPKLLELSGIGQKDLLTRFGIPIVIDNPNVGENMQNHLMSVQVLQLNEGVKLGPYIQALAFVPLEDSNEIPFDQNETQNQTLHNITRSMVSSTDEGSCCTFLGSGPAEGLALVVVIPSIVFSRGTTHISSSDPDEKPRIDPRFFSNSLDEEIMARHLRTVQRILSGPTLSPYFKPGGQLVPPPGTIDLSTTTDLPPVEKYLREGGALPTHHACGSVAMLPLEEGGVVDQDLLVYGTRNLRVVDASIFPMISHANPLATVYAVAERAADLIKNS
jgi:choline dehydrogenase-like flavoprotein